MTQHHSKINQNQKQQLDKQTQPQSNSTNQQLVGELSRHKTQILVNSLHSNSNTKWNFQAKSQRKTLSNEQKEDKRKQRKPNS